MFMGVSLAEFARSEFSDNISHYAYDVVGATAEGIRDDVTYVVSPGNRRRPWIARRL